MGGVCVRRAVCFEEADSGWFLVLLRWGAAETFLRRCGAEQEL